MERLITIVLPTYNEEGNVEELHARIRQAVAPLEGVRVELLFIDNASTDGTVERIRALAARDPGVRAIVNRRNFGQMRSPHHALLQARGDAVMLMAADLQDPPELIPQFIEAWAQGAPIVLGVKTSSAESTLMYRARTAYYNFLVGIGDVAPVKHATGFGCYDRAVIEALRELRDPIPYFRGQLAELGFPATLITFHQPPRKAGLTKNNLYTLYDIAMIGITSHSRVPLRLAVLTGFLLAATCLLVALGYLVAKLLFWNLFQDIGQAPTVIGLFFLGGVQLIFTGLVGEYLGAIHTQVRQRPLVLERERINFGELTSRVEASSTPEDAVKA